VHGTLVRCKNSYVASVTSQRDKEQLNLNEVKRRRNTPRDMANEKFEIKQVKNPLITIVV